MTEIRTSIETITPILAKEWLSYNINNRPLNKDLVKHYAAAMTRGEWVLNGDAIRFSVTGRLLDSQHRLHAVVQSGVTIQSVVVYGLPDEVFQTIDGGKKRSIGDVLGIDGHKNRNVLGPRSPNFTIISKELLRDFKVRHVGQPPNSSWNV